MSIESEVFKKTKLYKNKLLEYGFKVENNIFTYSKELSNGFIAVVKIDEKELLTGKIFDVSLNEEYTNFRIESLKGEFVNSVREEYKELLNEIKAKCFEELYFRTPQANRITNEIIKEYQTQPEFLWETSPDHAIFRHKTNQKWFALIAYVDRNKLDRNTSGMVEILNLKIREEELNDLLNQKGFYIAWHMNKKSWITLILDETISDIEILKYIKNSYIYTS